MSSLVEIDLSLEGVGCSNPYWSDFKRRRKLASSIYKNLREEAKSLIPDTVHYTVDKDYYNSIPTIRVSLGTPFYGNIQSFTYVLSRIRRVEETEDKIYVYVKSRQVPPNGSYDTKGLQPIYQPRFPGKYFLYAGQSEGKGIIVEVQ